MRKRAIPLIALVAASFVACGAAKFENHAEQRDFVEGVVQGKPAEVAAKIRQAFGTNDRNFEGGNLSSVPGYNNYDPHFFRFKDSPSMDRYVALPAETRRDDIYLMNAISTWSSEYTGADGKPLSFSCSFVVHLSPEDSDSTKVVVLEVETLLRTGEKVLAPSHGILPSWVSKIELVAPTTRDRVKLLERIQAIARGEQANGGKTAEMPHRR